MINEPEVCFIGGVGRSGTSITRTLLGKHPSAASLPFEYRFIIDPDGIVDFLYAHKGQWTPYLYDRKYSRLAAFLKRISTKNFKDKLGLLGCQLLSFLGVEITKPAYCNWELGKHIPGFESYIETLLHSLSHFAYSAKWVGSKGGQFSPQIHYLQTDWQELFLACKGFLYSTINSLIEHQEAKILIEDNTWNLLYCRELLELFPTAKFIHVKRDPRDVVASFVRQSWMPEEINQATKICIDLYRQTVKNCLQLPSSQLMTVKLEQLTANPQKEMQKMIGFCGLEESEVGLRIIDNSVHGQWRKQFDELSQSKINEELSDLLHELGYAETQ